MAAVRSFHRYRGESSFTIAQFGVILREQIALVVPRQTKYRVSEFPSERTIKFYTANGLVDKPFSTHGSAARYGYRHLLQLLAIKYLQSQYLPLIKIKSLVENISNRELELIIPEIPVAAGAHRGLARDGLLGVENSVYQHPYSFESRHAEPSPAAIEIPGPAVGDTWRRVEIGPGIELHINTAALSVEQIERLRGALLQELGTLRGWFGEKKG